MDTITVLKSRRSCRNFDGRPITEEELNIILEAGTYAPTGTGRQSPIMVAVQDKETVAKISK